MAEHESDSTADEVVGRHCTPRNPKDNDNPQMVVGDDHLYIRGLPPPIAGYAVNQIRIRCAWLISAGRASYGDLCQEAALKFLEVQKSLADRHNVDLKRSTCSAVAASSIYHCVGSEADRHQQEFEQAPLETRFGLWNMLRRHVRECIRASLIVRLPRMPLKSKNAQKVADCVKTMNRYEGIDRTVLQNDDGELVSEVEAVPDDNMHDEDAVAHIFAKTRRER